MRVAHVAPSGVHPYSGLLASLVYSAVAASERGVDVEVWQLHRWPDDDTADLRQRLIRAGVELVPMEPAARRWRWPAVAASQLLARPVDVVHLHGVFNPTNSLLARDLQVPYVVSPHGGYAAESLAFHRVRKLVFKHLVELAMLRRAATVCAVTEQEAAELQRFGVRTPIEVVPNGARIPAADLDRAAFRDELGLGRDSRLAVYAGRIDVAAKRLDQVVQAIATAPGWHLALLGGDFRDGKATVKRLAGRFGVNERVHMPAPRRAGKLDEALAAADVFVLVSRSEGLPMALLEALAAGTPAVVSSEVDRAVAVSASGAGWVVAPASLSPLLRRLDSSTTEEWAGYRAAARGLAGGYDWARVAEGHEAVYRQALGTAPSA